MNSFYHNLPAITLGSSTEGAIGRQFVKEKKAGINLSQPNSQALENAVREVVFDPMYRNNLKDISRYLKGMNTNYLIPNIIFNHFSAKSSASSSKTDL